MEKKHYSDFFAMHKADYLPKMAILLVWIDSNSKKIKDIK